MKNTFQVYDWVLPIDNYLNLESAKPLFDPDITSQYINLLSSDQSEDEEKDLPKVPTSDPIYIPKPEHKSTLSYTPSPGEDPFKESYLKAVGEEDNMYKFFSLLAKNESGYNPKAKNPHAPAYGYFQVMQDGIRYNNISHYGNVGIDTFLNTPEIQINAARSLADSFLSHLNKDDLSKMAEKGITRSGALGGMWLGGYGGFKRYLYNDENISDKHWNPSGAGIDMKTQIERYNGLFKKGGRIEKASLGTVFSTDKPRDQRGSGVDTSRFYYNVPIETAYTKPKIHNYKARRSYDLKQVSDSGDLYYNIIHNRTNDAKDALIRNGFTKDIDFLKQILALQSIRESGWVDRVENNNYGGYTKGEGNEKVKLTFPSAEAFWDHHINNLNSKWGESNVRGAWYESNSLEDYINRINNPDLNTTKSDYNKYNYNRRLNGEPEQYLYAPIWDNKGRNYLDDIKEVVDRYFYYYNN